MTSDRYDVDDEIYLSTVLTEEDIPSFIKYLNSPTIHANTLTIPFPYTKTDGEEFLQLRKSTSPDAVKYFSIRLASNNELIGACGINRKTNNPRRTEIGYWLGEQYWHRGLMPKVVKKTIEIVTNEWKNLVRIEGNIFSWNKASMRVLEKCGFEFEGILRRHVYKNGQDIDVHSYALILE